MTTLGIFTLGCWGGFGMGLLFAGAARAIAGPASSAVQTRVSEVLEGYSDLAGERAGS